MKAYKYEELQRLSLDELKQAYDASADRTDIALSFLREEIFRRETQQQTQRMNNMTLAILVLTVVNVVMVVVSLF